MNTIQSNKINIEELPSPPSVAIKLLELFSDPDVTIQDIAKVIQVDPALTAKIVSYCNSPLIESSRSVETLDRAIVLLGMGVVRMIALSFSLLEMSDDEGGFNFKLFWTKSLALAVSSQAVAKHTGMDSDNSFLAGLMLNIGEIAIFRQGKENEEKPSCHVDIETLIANEIESHSINRFEVAVEILKDWGFPKEITDNISKLGESESSPEQRHFAMAWRLANLYTDSDWGFNEVDECRQLFREELSMDEEQLESLFAEAMEKWHEYAELLDFKHEMSANSLREIELAAKIKMTEISIAQVQNQQKIEQENELLRSSAGRDTLTGVQNRRAYEEQTFQALARCRRTERPFSLLVIDIDYFKKCNDTYGHQIGDEALVHVAHLLSGKLREYENIYRYGGEEFVVTLPECERTLALAVAERLRESVEQSPLLTGDHTINLSVSIGIVSSDCGEAETVKELFEIADKCLYRAKANGRNCCVMASE